MKKLLINLLLALVPLSSFAGINNNPVGGVTIPNATYTPEEYGGQANGKVINDVSSTNTSTQITSASAAFTSADVGKAVALSKGTYVTFTGTTNGTTTISALSTTTNVIAGMTIAGLGIPKGATISSVNTGASTMVISSAATLSNTGVGLGATPPYQLTTIATYTNATTVQLAAAAGFTGSNLHMVYGTDNSAYIQSAINAANTNGGGTVQFRSGIYVCAGAFQNTTVQNGVLSLPHPTNQALPIVTLVFQGSGGAGLGPSGYYSYPAATTGTVLYCPTVGTGTNPSFISGSDVSNATQFCAVNFVANNITFRTPVNPTIGHLNEFNGGGVTLNGCLFDVDYTAINNWSLPATNNVAVALPNYENGGISRVDNCEFNNLGTAVEASYHTSICRSQISASNIGVYILTGSVGIFNTHLVGNAVDFYGNGSGYNTLFGNNVELEDQTTGNFICTATFVQGTAIVGHVAASGNAIVGSVPVGLWFELKIGNTQAYTQYDPPTAIPPSGGYFVIQAPNSSSVANIAFNKSNGGLAALFGSNEAQTKVQLQLASGWGYDLLNNGSQGLSMNNAGDMTNSANDFICNYATAGTAASFDSNKHLISMPVITSGSGFSLRNGINTFTGSTASQTLVLPTPVGGCFVFVKNQASVPVTLASSAGSQIVIDGAAAIASTVIPIGSSTTLWSDGTNFYMQPFSVSVQTGTLSGGTATKTVPSGCHPWVQDNATSLTNVGTLTVTVSGTTATITSTNVLDTSPFTLFNAGSQ